MLRPPANRPATQQKLLGIPSPLSGVARSVASEACTPLAAKNTTPFRKTSLWYFSPMATPPTPNGPMIPCRPAQALWRREHSEPS
eukprot:11227033-Lingulodinium_polyedra.AAC.1